MTVIKHAQHDQSTHGNWATGSSDGYMRLEFPGGNIEQAENDDGTGPDPNFYLYRYGDVRTSLNLANVRAPQMLGSRSVGGAYDSLEALGQAVVDRSWGYWDHHFAIRTIASNLMGVQGPVAGDVFTPEEDIEALEYGTGPNAEQIVPMYLGQAHGLIQATASAEPAMRTFFRGMVVPEDSAIPRLRIGDEFDIPPSSFAPDEQGARIFMFGGEGYETGAKLWEAEDYIPRKTADVMFRLAPGARIVSVSSDTDLSGLGGDPDLPWDNVAQGRFKVTGWDREDNWNYSDDAPRTRFVIDIQQVAVFDPAKGGWVKTDEFMTLPDGTVVPMAKRSLGHDLWVGFHGPHPTPSVAKHLPGEHDQLSHGSWSSRSALNRLAAPSAVRRRPEALDTRSLYSNMTIKGLDYDDTRERRYHDRYVKDKLAGASGGTGTFVMMGGGPASGKSTVLRGVGTDGKVVVNADEAKEYLPEYRRGMSSKDARAAAVVHEESSDMSKRLLREALSSGFDTILDGVGNGTIEGLTDKIRQALSLGAKRVVAEYVTVPIDVARRRNRERFAVEGRSVPDKILVEAHQRVSQVFPLAIERSLFDEARLWDGDVPFGEPPKLILEYRDGRVTIYDDRAWQEFLAKNPEYRGS